jgi:hypothetical protein
MKRALPHPLALALATAALALLPAVASAKEVVKAKVCGADGCVTVGPSAAVNFTDGGPPTDPPKEAAPFYTAEMTVRGDGEETFTFKTTFVPKGGLLRGDDGTWMDAPLQTENAFKRAVGIRDLQAFPASKLGPLPTPISAQVDEVVRPPADPAPVSDDGSSTSLIGFLGLAGAVATWALVAHVRRRRAAEGTPPAAPTPPAG